MQKNKKTKKIFFLKELNHKDITKDYVQWMNNYEIVKYSDHSLKKITTKDVIKYVKEKKKSKIEFLYGIFLKKGKEKNEHIGNIKLGPINKMHRYSTISYIIGKKKYWNKGYTTKAISEVIIIAKFKFKLKKLQAGVIEINHPGAKQVLKKNNFKKEGVFKSQRIFEKKRYTNYIYGLNL